MDSYESAKDTCKDTVGIVYLGRATGEGGDLYTLEYEDGTPHQLALTEKEKELIAFAEKNCTKGVVVVLNACNTMEIPELADDDKINAILQICTPGALGFKSLGKILNGTVNPSGRTVDTFSADLTKTPTYVNFNNGTGNTVYENASYTRDIWLAKFKGGSEFQAPFREYEEGVYMGYCWYETASDLGYFETTNLATDNTDPYYNRNNGLSYTEFKQEITSYTDEGDEISVTVNVTNTGDTHAGKDVVQIYYAAPYTEFDVENLIEKPTANLADYAKTDILEPGQSQEVTVSFAKEDMASYCFTHDNGNDTTGCYVLENGDYSISLRANSHDIIEEKTTTIDETFWYDGSDEEHIRTSEKNAQSLLDNAGESTGAPAKSESDADATYVAATNEFDNANLYMTDSSVGNDVTILTRDDWSNSQPSAPTEQTRQASDTVKTWLDYGYTTLDYGLGTWDEDGDPVLGNNENSKVYVPEEDMPASNDEINSALFANGYASGKLSSVGKMATSEHDGPQGIGLNDNDGNSWVSCCSFPSATTFCALKHFAMVDQEEQRWWIPSVWATEQTIREIYLKAFEIAVKDATKTIKYISDDNGTVTEKAMRACDNMMTSGWSGIGGLFSAYDYNLLTGVLRNEWGFQGFVITDYDQGNGANDNIAVNRMVRAGTDQHMIDMTLSPGKYTSLDTATGVTALRKAVKNTLFTMANSAQVNNAAPGATVYYKTSPWRCGVIAVDVLVGLIALLLIWLMIRRTKDEKKNPEKYKNKKIEVKIEKAK